MISFTLPPPDQSTPNANARQDVDLLNAGRSLTYAGKLRRHEMGSGWNRWTELFCLLFDHYCRWSDVLEVTLTDSPTVVMTRPKEEDGVTKYEVYQRASRNQFRVGP